ncbi:hypothetical protein SAOR_11315 [Salinisphaera orenii MK-B5]|uniref:Uncharacterized protein n=2 Tax=Salinisphaera TaxID=180541 RepID=A0A423PL70_9GAMM|nr:hypothetical protein SAOR_11315 [Salinisphaera orenii MK-B5]
MFEGRMPIVVDDRGGHPFGLSNAMSGQPLTLFDSTRPIYRQLGTTALVMRHMPRMLLRIRSNNREIFPIAVFLRLAIDAHNGTVRQAACSAESFRCGAAPVLRG